MKIGLYFGSFNPIHIGHLIIANFVASNIDVEQVWLIVSPQNPLKPAITLLNEYHRLHLVKLAIGDHPKIKVSDIEFRLPRPSFTIDTLTYLSEKYPSNQFSIIIGSDSYRNIANWKNHQLLIKNYQILVYLRPGFDVAPTENDNVILLKAPLLNISSTYIRQLIKQKKSIHYFIPELPRVEIEQNNYYL